jgi:hypothetical protein
VLPRVFVAFGLAGLLLAFFGCETRTEPLVGFSPGNGPTGGSGSCETPNEGCACPTDGESVPCGSIASVSVGTIECTHGWRTCEAGKWGACDGLGVTTTQSIPLVPQALGTSTPCTDNPCNPYCNGYTDTPTGVDAGTAFTLAEGGLTLAGTGSCQGAPNVDDDGDGWTEQEGDCNDCSKVVNPGAIDYAANGFDDDCDGTIDNAPTTCDSALTLASTTGDDYAKAIDLCNFTTASATGSAKKWGVISGTPKLVQADATTAPAALQYGIMPFFGNSASNGARRGTSLAVFSSGTARYAGQSGYVSPKGWCGSYNANTAATTPCGLAWNKSGCAAGTGGYDSSGMTFQVRVPTNAQCMSFRFHYLSSEYPEWVCSAYNDSFVAMLKSSKMTAGTGCCGTAPNVNCNISYGANTTPVSVNNNLFSIPGCTSCISNSLLGTGFDGTCGGFIKGGSTGWLYSFAPVTPGEIATFHTSIWDTGDHAWDSTVLVDDWQWYPGSCSIGTSPSPPTTLPTPPTQNPYVASSFTRDFVAACSDQTVPVWRDFSYTAVEPLDSKVIFTVQSAQTQGALAAATSAALTTASGYSVPTAGTADVKAALATALLPHRNWLRVTMAFQPSTNTQSVPTVFKWAQKYDCVPGL